MGIITEEMKQLVLKQKLGFVATVSPDNTPNLSPKGTTTVWDDDHLIFADINSPKTMANLQKNNSIEINVVDHITRKGFRFKGTASIVKEQTILDKMITQYKNQGIKSEIKSVVLVKVENAQPIIAPSYDLGFTEEQIKAKWKDYYLSS